MRTISENGEQVLLISLPWTNVIEPNLGLALLKSILKENGINARVLHLNLFLLDYLKATTYEAISVVYALNDFLFSYVLDPEISHAQKRLLRLKAEDVFRAGAFSVDRGDSLDDIIDHLIALRNEHFPLWLDKWAEEIASSEARLVGFTCMFDQTIASLALAKLIKQRAPEKLLVLGGYAVRNPTGEMIMNCHPWVDAICYGEGETTVVELARAVHDKVDLSKVCGILYRDEAGKVKKTAVAPKADLNDNPVPDYADFFADTSRLSKELKVDLKPSSIPIENSRGCWWGAKHHCVFCGIHDNDLAYRHKSAEKVVETLRSLRASYGMNNFRFSDYILPNDFYKTLLPILSRENPKFVLSCEMKANVSESQVQLLAEAGFHEVQPGIESFSSNVLKQMDKGVSGVQNIFTLKLGSKYGIRILYNILYGFPFDELADYQEMAELLPKLNHFDPPVSCVPVQVTRYAPLQSNPSRFGLAQPMHGPTYELIFNKDYVEETGFDYGDFCYYFDRQWENSLYLQNTYGEIYNIVKEWGIPKNDLLAQLYRDPGFSGKGTLIHDTRTGDDKEIKLDSLARKILDSTECPVGTQTLMSNWQKQFSQHSIEDSLDELVDSNFIIRLDNKFLSLVLPYNPAEATNHRYGFLPLVQVMELS